MLMVMGIDEGGYRQFLGTYMKTTETEASWSEVFTDLIDRGINPNSVKYIVSDKHKGMRKAMAKFFPGSSWQWCQTHYQRNAEAKISGKDETEKLHQHLRDVFNSPDYETARARADKLQPKFQGQTVWWPAKRVNESRVSVGDKKCRTPTVEIRGKDN